MVSRIDKRRSVAHNASDIQQQTHAQRFPAAYLHALRRLPRLRSGRLTAGHALVRGGLVSMHALGVAAHLHLTLAYFVINIDPILVQLGPIAIHWYGLMYVVAIVVALWTTLRYTRGLGMHDEQVWALFVWTAIAGLVGGRLYFVIQQPDLVSNYLLAPQHIIAVWNGGMAFFGAIFAGALTLFLLAPRYGLSRWIAIDGGALFAAVGQIFGRVGNIINGDIVGQAVSSGQVNVPPGLCAQAPCIAYISDPHILGLAEVYLNANSFARQGIAYQPAPVYEICFNLIMLAMLWPLRYRLPRIRAGAFFALYVALYAISQFIVFFLRGSEPITPFLGITALKQAQWTALAVLLLTVPLLIAVWRYSRPWPYSPANPVPWSPAPSGGPAADSPPSPAPSGSEGATKKRAGSGETKEPVAVAMTAAGDLPEWQPTRPTGGRLRNLFGARTGK
jgi:phosphatidylglycerol:prolipoprotein diacylglycerol transferase